MKALDLKGQRFERLIVIEKAPNKGRYTTWKCRCDCGAKIAVVTNHLRQNLVVSCGCKRNEHIAALGRKSRTHGRSPHCGRFRDYNTWQAMRNRCYDPTDHSFSHYGGRGIQVCARWFSFDNFFADMGEPPPGMTIHRKNNDGHYMPSNCKWATAKEQQNNRRNNHRIEINGVSKTVTEWATQIGRTRQAILYRIKHGWTERDAVLGEFKPRRVVGYLE